MATFMQSLAANPSGGSGIYGQTGGGGDGDVLNLVNALRDRELQDFKQKAVFMSDLSTNQQLRMRNLFNPEGGQGGPGSQNGQPEGQMKTVMAKDPNEMTAAERAELGIKQQGIGIEQQKLGLEGRRIAQTGELGEERQNLNQQKSDQIDTLKWAELNQRYDSAQKRMEEATARLTQNANDANAKMELNQARFDAQNAQHALEMAQKDAQFGVTSRQNEQRIRILQGQLQNAQRSQVNQSINPEGTARSIQTLRGNAATTVMGTGRDGRTYPVPVDKIPDWNANHAAPGTQLNDPNAQDDTEEVLPRER